MKNTQLDDRCEVNVWSFWDQLWGTVLVICAVCVWRRVCGCVSVCTCFCVLVGYNRPRGRLAPPTEPHDPTARPALPHRLR